VLKASPSYLDLAGPDQGGGPSLDIGSCDPRLGIDLCNQLRDVGGYCGQCNEGTIVTAIVRMLFKT
jgi:hypothetical protein